MVCLLIGLRKIAPVAPFLRGSTHEHGFVRMTGLRSDTLGSNGWTRRQRRMLKPSSKGELASHMFGWHHRRQQATAQRSSRRDETGFDSACDSV